MTERKTYDDPDLIAQFMCENKCPENDCDCSRSKRRKPNIQEALVKSFKTHLDPKPISYRSYLASAYSFFEEETLITLESKQPQTCIGAITEGSKKKQSAQGDKLMFKLKKLLDYVPKSYKGWERSKMQKIFHRNW